MNTTNPNRYDADVLIVGAGPTGLTLATMLARNGHRPMIVDRLEASQNTSRAAVIHAHTLEELETLGVTPRLIQAGMCLHSFSVRDRGSVLARLRFDRLPSRYPCLLMLPQDQTEMILADALHRAGCTVHWNSAVTSLQETPDSVLSQLRTAHGTNTVRTRYVIGADGMHSLVRQSAGIDFTGHRFEESFVLADVDLEWPHGHSEVMMFFSPSGPVVVAPLPGGRSRIVATMDHAPEQPGVDDIQQLLENRGPTGGLIQVREVYWSSRFRLHHRVADRYRQGRLLLVGDAAHVHSPAGGQGMNTGLVDACVLGKLLSAVLSGQQHESALDCYENLRRPAALQVLALSGRLTTAATLKGHVPRTLRNLAFRLIGHIPRLRQKLEMNLSGLARRKAAQLNMLVPDGITQTDMPGVLESSHSLIR